MQLFSADAIVFSNEIQIFFDPENMKKTPSKVAHNRPPIFFYVLARLPKTAQEQKSHTTKSPLMQEWVFRLGDRLIIRAAYLNFWYSL